MQTEYPHRKFYRLDAIRDELSPQAAERFDKLALFDQLRLEGTTAAAARTGCGGANGPPPSSSWCARRGSASSTATPSAGATATAGGSPARWSRSIIRASPSRPASRSRSSRPYARIEAVLHARLFARHRHLRHKIP